MKKLLAVILGAIFILGFSSSAFAIHAEIPSETQAVVATGDTQVSLSGEMRIRGWYLQNYSENRGDSGTEGSQGTPKATNSQTWYDQRVRLGVQADITKNTTGYLMLESAPDSGRSTFNSDAYAWGSAMNTKPGVEFTFLEAWIQHKGSGLLGIPAGFKAGHILTALGEKEFFDHTAYGDDALILFADPKKDLHIELWAAKFGEFTTTLANSNDFDMYSLLAVYRLDKDNTIGVNYSYLADHRQIVLDTGVPVEPGNNGSLQNVGVHANGKIAGVSYKGEADFQFGTRHTVSTDRTTFNGYGVFLGLDYKINPVNLRFEFALGSGDNNPNDNKRSEFVTYLGNDMHYTFIYDYTTRTASNTGDRAMGIANTTYYRLGLDYSPMKDLTASLDGFILRATKVAAGSNDIGTEIDAALTYKIDRNLVYFINAGYLAPGQWWVDNAGVTPQDKKGITQLVHGVTLNF